MSTKLPNASSAKASRRRFLQSGLGGAGLFGLGGLLGWFASLTSRAASRTAATRALSSDHIYDISPYLKTDPALVHFEESGSVDVPFSTLRAVVVDAADRIHVAGDGGIYSCSAAGLSAEKLSLPVQPRCLAVGESGDLYVGLKDRVAVYDAKGVRKASWKPLAGKAVLSSIALSEEHVFVADAGNRIVHRYDHSGNKLGEIGRKDSRPRVPGFIVPSPHFDTAWGSEGVLWVANPGNHRIEAYSSAGDFLTGWGKFSTAIKGFCGCCNPVHFARLPDGRFVTSEKGLPRVKVYSVDGEFESVVAGPEQFPRLAGNPNATPADMDVACDSSGRVLVADSMAGSVRIFTRKAAA